MYDSLSDEGFASLKGQVATLSSDQLLAEIEEARGSWNAAVNRMADRVEELSRMGLFDLRDWLALFASLERLGVLRLEAAERVGTE